MATKTQSLLEQAFQNKPSLRELAVFYEAFARRGWEGNYFHLLPTVETESYGIAYRLKYSWDATGAIAIFRKILNLAREAAGQLDVDEDLIPGWKEVADHLPPYATFRVGCGEILSGNPGAMPRRQAGDHEINSALYPAARREIPSELETENGQCLIFCAEAGHCYSVDVS